MNQQVIPAHTGLAPAAGAELGRFVCLDSVLFNGESWFLPRAFALLAAEKDVAGVVSYADPLERRTAAGVVYKRQHWGTIYQATNALFVGRSSPRRLLLAPSGQVVSERSLSKIRQEERGWRYASAQLMAAGAPPRVRPRGGGRLGRPRRAHARLPPRQAPRSSSTASPAAAAPRRASRWRSAARPTSRSITTPKRSRCTPRTTRRRGTTRGRLEGRSGRGACAGRPVGLMWLSPDCKHFSKAKGGKPVNKRVRGLAWVAVRWAKPCARASSCSRTSRSSRAGARSPREPGAVPERKGLSFRTFVGRLRARLRRRVARAPRLRLRRADDSEAALPRRALRRPADPCGPRRRTGRGARSRGARRPSASTGRSRARRSS
jgi:hypothetical protein